jgi:hypothetical protein
MAVGVRTALLHLVFYRRGGYKFGANWSEKFCPVTMICPATMNGEGPKELELKW